MAKSFKRLFCAALAAGAQFLSPAHAVVVCSACSYIPPGATYIGALNALTGEMSTFNSGNLVPPGPYVQTFIFDFVPVGVVTISGTISATATVDSFGLYAVVASVCPPLPSVPSTVGTLCASAAVGGLIASAPVGTIAISRALAAGRYAMVAVGTVSGTLPKTLGAADFPFSAQIVAQAVPQPASFALMLSGLAAVAFLTRRWRKA